MLFGTRVAETILASVHVRAHQQAGHMDASDLIKALQNALRGGGRPHMGQGLVGLVEELKGRGVGLKVLTGAGASIDTTKPEGRLFFAMFAAMAEFGRELIQERTRAGMTAAKKRGRHVGRPRKLTAERLAHARALIEDGRERADVAELLDVGTSTLRRAIKRAGGE